MDPDMAELAIERAIRRPAAGMPPDWVAAGAPTPPSTSATSGATPMPSSSSPPSFPSQTYFGQGATGATGVASGGGGAVGVDGGALDLDAILG